MFIRLINKGYNDLPIDLLKSESALLLFPASASLREMLENALEGNKKVLPVLFLLFVCFVWNYFPSFVKFLVDNDNNVESKNDIGDITLAPFLLDLIRSLRPPMKTKLQMNYIGEKMIMLI